MRAKLDMCLLDQLGQMYKICGINLWIIISNYRAHVYVLDTQVHLNHANHVGRVEYGCHVVLVSFGSEDTWVGSLLLSLHIIILFDTKNELNE